MKKRHIVLYITAGLWNLTVCWPAVLLIRLFWGENLRWERDPSGFADGPSLWCSLKKDSWPTRTWYALYASGSWLEFLKGTEPLKNSVNIEKRGTYRTWGGTTLGHGGFYGPGITGDEAWSRVQEHEHVHVEQFEASMLRSFITSLIWGTVLLAFGHWIAATVAFLLMWWSGYLWMGIANWVTAALRGEPAYYGSHHEESARAQDDHWREGMNDG